MLPNERARMDDEVLTRVQHVFGVDAGRKIYSEVLSELGVQHLSTPIEERRFADRLVKRGGLYEMVGRALRVRALLRGASQSTSSLPPK